MSGQFVRNLNIRSNLKCKICIIVFKSCSFLETWSIHLSENKNVMQLKLCESEVKVAGEVYFKWHSSLNLVSRQLKLYNIFVLGMVYSCLNLYLKYVIYSKLIWSGA